MANMKMYIGDVFIDQHEMLWTGETLAERIEETNSEQRKMKARHVETLSAGFVPHFTFESKMNYVDYTLSDKNAN